MIPHPTTAFPGVTWGPLPSLRPTPVSRPFPVGALPRYEQRLSAFWTLPGDSPHTPRAARAHVTGTCRTWHVPRQVTDSLTVIASELTTNAVVHAHGEEITVALLLSPHHVWVSVTDQGQPHTLISPRNTNQDAEDGRGLCLVEALATSWRATSSPSGTRVWACLALPVRSPTPAESTCAVAAGLQYQHPADPSHREPPGHPHAQAVSHPDDRYPS
ncbi:ATP-binding protein [Streptomyces sp. NPDC101225]|uniref:ATP-binding protein n=1 Tax=Streptomyces sp. NPDC101225 TaxID=3366135 RepID=UPI003828D70A